MRRTLALAVVATVASLGLAGALAFLVPPPGKDDTANREVRPVWTEAKWPFPMDQWGTGKAFTCRAADCGIELTVYLRAKIGFCNCTAGVADDEDLDRVGDVDLVSNQYSPLGPGQEIAVAWMKGRSRAYAIAHPTRSAAAALSVAFNDRCDVIVATLFVANDGPAASAPAVIAFLNSDVVLRWAEKTLGL